MRASAMRPIRTFGQRPEWRQLPECPLIMGGSLIRETPPAARMSAGMRSSVNHRAGAGILRDFRLFGRGDVHDHATPLSIWARLRLSSARFCVMSFPSFRRCLVSRFIY